jgi:4-amino-4-deoxy-L-arabinose transferase-like glycosyltransferase
MRGRVKTIVDRARAEPHLLIAIALGTGVALGYVLFVRPDGLPGDQYEYDLQARFFTQGHPWWSTTPFGVAHASMWKAPVYPAFLGILYTVLGDSPTKAEVVQCLLFVPLSIFAAWLLALHLFDRRVAAIAAYVVAVFPLAWEYFGLLYAESLAIPLTTLVLLLVLARPPTPKLAIGTGLLMGFTILVRPTSFFLFAGMAAAYVIAVGWKRGIGLTVAAVIAAVLVVAPWTIRNAVVTDGGFVPLSVQDAAAYGTFNDESANDPIYPYAWRPYLKDQPAVFSGKPVNDAVFRSKLQSVANDYIKDHPESVPKAFFWNGLSRLWDVRRPGRAVDEVPFEGRDKAVTIAGLSMYYVLLPLALFGLWRMRRRRYLVVPLLITALAASVVFTVASGTRYRAPLEPTIVILAVAALAAPQPKLEGRPH